MSRSKWKGPFLDHSLIARNVISRKIFSKKAILKIWSRRSVISRCFVGRTVLIYTGKVFKRIFITRDKVGYKFGEFCYTRVLKKKQLKVVTKKIKTKIKK